MSLTFFDRVPLTGVREDSNGNLVAHGRAARTGIQEYAGYEVGRPDLSKVRVYRPEDEVFHRDSMRSYAGAPVTIQHPEEMVTPSNWAKYAKGEVGSEDIVRDGETVAVPFLIRDANAIKQVKDGLHEISMGYTSEIDFTAGQTPAGEAYDAVQRTIRINHLAIVDRARGGPALRIGDSEQEPKTMTTETMLVDGLMVEVTPQAKAAIEKLTGLLKDAGTALQTAQTDITSITKERDDAKGEAATLKTQLEAAQDPKALQDAAMSRSKLVDQAKAIVPKIVCDGKSDADIRKEVVAAKLGDAIPAEQVDGAFAALAAGIKSNTTVSKDAVAEAIRTGSVDSGDTLTRLTEARDKARDGFYDHLHGRKVAADKE